MLVAVLRLFRRGKNDQAHAQTVQCFRSVIQAGLDEGSWETAWLLPALPDPVKKREFGGPPAQMAIISKCQKAMGELRKNRTTYEATPVEEWASAAPKDGNKPPKGKGGGKKR